VAGKIFSVICILSILCALLTGNIHNLSPAIFEGAARAVDLSIGLLSVMCLYSGLLEVLRTAGAIKLLSRLISPLLKLLFPTAYKTGNGIDECSANIAANILGIGNAATPFALSAMAKMQKDNTQKTTASDDMITLAVINSSPVSILPVTLITLRTLAGSVSPEKIIMPIWICSTFGTLFAILTLKIFKQLWNKKCLWKK
jgi:spore maturation protein A